MRRTGLFIGSICAAFAASLCCILPLVAAVTGIGALAVAARWESYRPMFLAATAVLLSSGLFLVYRSSKTGCTPEGLCKPNAGKPKLWSLPSVIVLVLGIASFPYFSGSAVLAMEAEKKKEDSKGATVTKVIPITGMTCPACANGLEASFRNLPGAKAAKVDYAAKRAIVTYDPAKQSLKTIERLIVDSGYQVK